MEFGLSEVDLYDDINSHTVSAPLRSTTRADVPLPCLAERRESWQRYVTVGDNAVV